MSRLLCPLSYGPYKAGGGNRTHNSSLEGCGNTILQRPQVQVGAAGLEPATSASQTQRASRLRHAP